MKEEVSPGMETKTDSFPSVSSVSVCSGEETWSWEALKDNKEAEDVIVQRLHVCVKSLAGMGERMTSDSLKDFINIKAGTMSVKKKCRELMNQPIRNSDQNNSMQIGFKFKHTIWCKIGFLVTVF